MATTFQNVLNEARKSNYIFQDLAKKGLAAGYNIRQKDIENSREWFRNQALEIKKADPKKMIDTAGAFERMDKLSDGSIGKMYMFAYDAKTKDKLPYWDRYPLIFPIEYYGDSFLGINLHYLPPLMRAKLMNALYETLNNDKMDKTTKLKISYKILKSTTRFALFKPCIKKYLFSHIRSSLTYIKPEYWDSAVMLPTDRFQKKSAEYVWKKSMEKV